MFTLACIALLTPAACWADLLGHWPMDDGLFGDRVPDVSARSCNGRPVLAEGVDARAVPGRIGAAASFVGGADGYVPDKIVPPPWGVHSLSYVRDVQPVFDRACADCHQGGGEAVETLDLALRRDELVGEARWGGIFPEPYLTLVLGQDHSGYDGWPSVPASRNYIGSPTTDILDYGTLPPLTYLSPNSPLIAAAMDRTRCGQNLSQADLEMLIAWVDLWAMFRSDEEIREIEDPPSEWFPLWAYPPKMRTAPHVRTEYSQDEFAHPEDRLAGKTEPSS